MMQSDPVARLIQAGLDRQRLLQGDTYGLSSLPTNAFNLSMDQVHMRGWQVEQQAIELPAEYHSRVARAGITPLGTRFCKTCLLGSNSHSEWEGILGPGLMIIQFIAKADNDYLNWVSSLIGFVYQMTFPDDKLSYMFINHVTDVETTNLYRDHVYQNWHTASFNSQEGIPPASFDSGSRIYHALLGTEFGKIIFFLILSSSERGTVQLSRISIWAENNGIQLRFDIEPCGEKDLSTIASSSRLTNISTNVEPPTQSSYSPYSPSPYPPYSSSAAASASSDSDSSSSEESDGEDDDGNGFDNDESDEELSPDTSPQQSPQRSRWSADSYESYPPSSPDTSPQQSLQRSRWSADSYPPSSPESSGASTPRHYFSSEDLERAYF